MEIGFEGTHGNAPPRQSKNRDFFMGKMKKKKKKTDQYLVYSRSVYKALADTQNLILMGYLSIVGTG